MRQIKPGDIGFTFKRHNLFSRIIYAVAVWRTSPKSDKKVSHCFICLDEGMIAEATFGGVAIVNMKKYFDGEHDVYLKTPTEPITHYDRVKGDAFVRESAGVVRYAFWELINLFLTKWFRYRIFAYSRKEMMCSEFAAEYYASFGRSLTGKDAAASTPLDVFDSSALVDL